MDDKKYLTLAHEEAAHSQEPIACGAILVDTAGDIIARSFNSQRADNLTASHAEMKAIAEANKKRGRKLTGLTLYGSCEPCTMCLTALIFAGVDRIVFSHRLNELVAPDEKIDIDCFEFVSRFPHHPKLEHIPL